VPGGLITSVIGIHIQPQNAFLKPVPCISLTELRPGQVTELVIDAPSGASVTTLDSANAWMSAG
jgi:hypothetical protein